VISLEERRELLLRRGELSGLAQLSNWLILGAVIEEEVDRIKRAMMAQMMGKGISLEEQAFMRGRIIGLRAARSIPEHALRAELTESSPIEEEVAASE
jgi:hypothetical protein